MSHPFTFRPGTVEEQVFDAVNIYNEYRLPDTFRAEDIVVDIGAHIGSFCYAALQRGSHYVYGFEPEASNYECAVRNLQSFGDRVHLYNKAVWRSDQVVEKLFFVGSVDAANTSGGGVVWPDEGTPVDVAAFDDVIRDVTDGGKKRVKLLKIDCEGAEFPILLTSRMLHVIDNIHGEFHEAGGDYENATIPKRARVPGYSRFTIDELTGVLQQAGFRVTSLRHDSTHMGLFFATREPRSYAVDAMPERVALDDGVAHLPFRPDPPPDGRLFVVDIYSFGPNAHPEFHLGWWAWPAAEALEADAIRLVYRSPAEVEIYLVCADGERSARDHWLNPDYRLAPLQHMQLLWYDDQHRVARAQASVIMTVGDDRLLQAYYAQNDGRYTLTHPYLQAFHERRIDVLSRLFRRYIRPGSRVLDIGSGQSMFYLIGGERWPYRITCFDLNRELMKSVAPDRPSYNWLVAAMQYLPFADASFDAVYAGEVIEHIPNGEAALADWVRVLRPGGTLIVTTPNRERLLNRINHTTLPVSYEHLVEFTCDELTAMFERNGCDVLDREGIYLELLALWRQRYPFVDPISVPQPLRRHLLALKPLLALARPLPWLAWDMVFVGRRRPGS
jgi:FkbM family methyltransferase